MSDLRRDILHSRTARAVMRECAYWLLAVVGGLAIGVAVALAISGAVASGQDVPPPDALHKIEVLVLPGSDPWSDRFVMDPSRPYGERTGNERRLKELKADIESVAVLRYLSKNTLGSDIPRPAVRIGHAKWESIAPDTKGETGGGIVRLRALLDPWVCEFRYSQAYAAWEAERVRVQAQRQAIHDRWHAAHGWRAVYLGEFDTRCLRDPVTGLVCVGEPLLPETPDQPDAPVPFDPACWLPNTCKLPVEADRPE